jgi:hypothetical protein
MGRKPKYSTDEERVKAQREQMREYAKKKKAEDPDKFRATMRDYYHKKVEENNALKIRLKELENKLQKMTEIMTL